MICHREVDKRVERKSSKRRRGNISFSIRRHAIPRPRYIRHFDTKSSRRRGSETKQPQNREDSRDSSIIGKQRSDAVEEQICGASHSKVAHESIADFHAMAVPQWTSWKDKVRNMKRGSMVFLTLLDDSKENESEGEYSNVVPVWRQRLRIQGYSDFL
jgi:hypothetical protein